MANLEQWLPQRGGEEMKRGGTIFPKEKLTNQ